MIAQIDITGVRLETDRLILRPWTIDDLQDFFEYASIEGLGQMAGWLPHKTIDDSKAILDMFIRSRRVFAVELKETGKVIGSLGIEEPDPDPEQELLGRELGYVLHKAYWGQGLMPEAAKRVISWCFEELKLDYLTCSHFDWNMQSSRVIEKTGFRYCSTTPFTTQYGKVETSMNYILYKEDGR
jgi:ribosomal-protein-alanine N-acetyltransferase